MEELQQILKCQPSPPVVGDDPRKSGKKISLGYNTCYIVCGLVVQDGKVLMIQEAKLSCRGQWYLPAGRVEKKESLEDAVRREVKEEAGLDFEPEVIIAVEFQSYQWIRFTFTGRITGGHLKTTDEADKESLQAQWLPVDEDQLLKQVRIRAYDCLRVIKLASDWYSEKKEFRYSRSIVPVSSQTSSIRVVLVHRESTETMLLVKDTPAGQAHLPVGNFHSLLENDIKLLLKACGYEGPIKEIGLLTVEHSPSVGDGIGVTVLVEAKERQLNDGRGFHWEPIKEPEILERIKCHFEHTHSTVVSMSL